jgi:hypothetical protein
MGDEEGDTFDRCLSMFIGEVCGSLFGCFAEALWRMHGLEARRAHTLQSCIQAYKFFWHPSKVASAVLIKILISKEKTVRPHMVRSLQFPRAAQLPGGMNRESPEGKSYFLVVRDRVPGQFLDLYGDAGRVGSADRY